MVGKFLINVRRILVALLGTYIVITVLSHDIVIMMFPEYVQTLILNVKVIVLQILEDLKSMVYIFVNFWRSLILDITKLVTAHNKLKEENFKYQEIIKDLKNKLDIERNESSSKRNQLLEEIEKITKEKAYYEGLSRGLNSVDRKSQIVYWISNSLNIIRFIYDSKNIVFNKNDRQNIDHILSTVHKIVSVISIPLSGTRAQSSNRNLGNSSNNRNNSN